MFWAMSKVTCSTYNEYMWYGFFIEDTHNRRPRTLNAQAIELSENNNGVNNRTEIIDSIYENQMQYAVTLECIMEYCYLYAFLVKFFCSYWTVSKSKHLAFFGTHLVLVIWAKTKLKYKSSNTNQAWRSEENRGFCHQNHERKIDCKLLPNRATIDWRIRYRIPLALLLMLFPFVFFFMSGTDNDISRNIGNPPSIHCTRMLTYLKWAGTFRVLVSL